MIYHESENSVVRTNQIELSAGTFEYQDSRGDGPVILMLHGLLMDHRCGRRSSRLSRPSTDASRRRCHWEPTSTGWIPKPTFRHAA